jgi:serine phosphatase RsbU (regulator of sigma subunit)
VVPARPYAWLSPRRRHSGVLVYLVSSAALAAFLGPVGFLSSSKTLLGIPGSGAALVVVLAAVLAGPIVGVLVAVTAGALFFAFVADLGSVGAPVGTIGGVVIWSVSALVAGRAADALRASTRERDRERETAVLYETLEAGLLPRLPFAHPGVDVLARYIPSEQRLNLGGDFLDIVTLDDGTLAMIIGDVAGHGPAAAALGTTLRAAWRGLVFAGSDPPTVLATLNRTVFGQQPTDGTFVTACLAWLDGRRGRLTYMAVGHPPMVIVDADGSRALESHPTLPLGVASRITPVFTDVALLTPWSLVAYTDGLIEGRTTPESAVRYGEDRLLGDLSGLGPLGLTDETVDRLLGEIRAANGGRATDDIALLVISASELADAARVEATTPGAADQRVATSYERQRQTPA